MGRGALTPSLFVDHEWTRSRTHDHISTYRCQALDLHPASQRHRDGRPPNLNLKAALGSRWSSATDAFVLESCGDSSLLRSREVEHRAAMWLRTSIQGTTGKTGMKSMTQAYVTPLEVLILVLG